MTLERKQIIRDGSLESLKSKYSGLGIKKEVIEKIVQERESSSLIGSDVVVRSSGKATYPGEWYIFREMIQNSQRGYVDLDQHIQENKKLLETDREKQIIEERPVYIWFNRTLGDEIEIHLLDFGYGIDKDHLIYFIALKRSKDTGTSKYASWFGMGTFSADLISKYMIVETTNPNSTELLIGSINFELIRENEQKKGQPDYIDNPMQLLEKACGMWYIQDGAKKDDHFTHIILYVKKEINLFEKIEEIKNFIADCCPVPFKEWKITENHKEFNLKEEAEKVRNVNLLAKNPLSICFNGEKINKRYSSIDLYDIQEPIEGQGKFIYTGSLKDEDNNTLGKYWYVIRGKRGQCGPENFPETENYILGLYVDGFLWDKPVKKDFLISLAKTPDGKNPSVNKAYLGEIHIESNSLVHPNQARTEIAGGPFYDKKEGQLKDKLTSLIDNLASQRRSLGEIEVFRKKDLPGIIEQIQQLDEFDKTPISSRTEVDRFWSDFNLAIDTEYYGKLGPPAGSLLSKQLSKKGARTKIRRFFEQYIKDDLTEIDKITTQILEEICNRLKDLDKRFPPSILTSPPATTKPTTKPTPTTPIHEPSPTTPYIPTTTPITTQPTPPSIKNLTEKWTIIVQKDILESLIKKFINRAHKREKFLEQLKKFIMKKEEIENDN